MKGSIKKRGKTSFLLRYDLPRDPETGRRHRVEVTFRGSKADAEAELRRRLSALDKGVHVDPKRLTLGAYLDSWLAEIAPATASPKTLQRYSGYVRVQIAPHLGDVQLQKLRPADVSAWLGKLRATDLSTKSIIDAHGVLKLALAHAASVEMVERNVATLVRSPKRERKEIEILNAEQIADTLDQLRGHPLHPVAVLAFTSGARRGELAALRWPDLDLDAAKVRIDKAAEQVKEVVRIKTPKTAAGRRTISLPAYAIDVLRTHRKEQLELRMRLGAGRMPKDAPVFQEIDGTATKPDSISDRWRDVVKARKLPKVTFHALRHSHASALIAAGLDVVSVSRRLGHADPAITLRVYSHLFESKDDKAAAAIDAALAPR